MSCGARLPHCGIRPGPARCRMPAHGACALSSAAPAAATTTTIAATTQHPTRHLTAPLRVGLAGGSGDWATAGAGYVGRSAGKWCFEVEVLEAEGQAEVGIAGTNFRGSDIGGFAEAWAIYNSGNTFHRLVPCPVAFVDMPAS